MPARKTNFYENGFYHVYNRGVEKRNIFLDDEDYVAYTGILKTYLSENLPKEEKPQLQGRALERIKKHSLASEVGLVAYCLMPNHFHLLLQQRTPQAITQLMRRVLTTYSMYFNQRYDRVGSLFQGRFKAIEVTNDEYLLHLTRYIHRNPVAAKLIEIKNLVTYKYSSYPVYLGVEYKNWLRAKPILDYFLQINSHKDYKNFVDFETEEILPDSLSLD